MYKFLLLFLFILLQDSFNRAKKWIKELERQGETLKRKLLFKTFDLLPS